jgi:transposase
MPKPVPIPVRRKLFQLAQEGQAVAHLAVHFGLPARTVRHLLKRFAQRGEAAVRPDYHLPLWLPQAYSAKIREAALAVRRAHPTWGAELIRIALCQRQPRGAWPSARTLRRWFQAAGLGPAPRGHRPAMPQARAKTPHQTWQIDASERIPLRGGKQVS